MPGGTWPFDETVTSNVTTARTDMTDDAVSCLLHSPPPPFVIAKRPIDHCQVPNLCQLPLVLVVGLGNSGLNDPLDVRLGSFHPVRRVRGDEAVERLLLVSVCFDIVSSPFPAPSFLDRALPTNGNERASLLVYLGETAASGAEELANEVEMREFLVWDVYFDRMLVDRLGLVASGWTVVWDGVHGTLNKGMTFVL